MFNYKRNTINNYIRTIESRIKPVLGFYKLTDINTLAIQNFINDIKKEEIKQKENRLFYGEYIK